MHIHFNSTALSVGVEILQAFGEAMNSAIQRTCRTERVVLLGGAMMFFVSAYLSVVRDRDEGSVWIFNFVFAIVMLLVLTAALLAPSTNVKWDEKSLAVSRGGRLVLDGDWSALRIERMTRRKYQIKDEDGRDVLLFADRLPEDLVAQLKKTSVDQGGAGQPPARRGLKPERD